MKKLMTILLSAVMILGLTACGSTAPAKQDAPAAAQKEAAAKPGKTLVVYYSASGVTKKVATYIAAETKADLFEVKPDPVYSSADLDYRDANSRVSKEHNTKERNVKLVADTAPDFKAYDTVFIGYPIWWGIAAWPVDTFVKANDFNGKKVITFATAASSGFGNSGRLLKEMGKGGTWIDGVCFHGANENEVKTWIKKLSL